MSNNQKIVLPVSIGDYANVLQYFMAQIFDVKIIAYVLDQLQDKISLIESLDVISWTFSNQLTLRVHALVKRIGGT